MENIKQHGCGLRNRHRRRRSSVNVRGGAQNFYPKIYIKNQQNSWILLDSWPKNDQNTGFLKWYLPEKFTKFPNFTWFLPEKYVLKISKIPEFYMILARKNYQNTGIFMTFARKIYKIPEFYMILPEKCPNFT